MHHTHHNPFLESSEKRLQQWKAFRESLMPMDEPSQLKEVVDWFKQAPTVNFSIDCDDPSNWPTPWELIEDGKICDNGIALLMEQTLILVGWDPNRLQLILVKNVEDQILRLCLLVDDHYILNYSYSNIINWKTICKNCLVQAKFKYEEKKHSAF